MTELFTANHLQQLSVPQFGPKRSNGQLTIIAGSDLFHGPALLTLKIASRMVDMVFFSSPHPELETFSNQLKFQLGSFIWVPYAEINHYIQKSSAVLIGPGLKRYRSEDYLPQPGQPLDSDGQLTQTTSLSLFEKFPQQNWVVDAGTLQTIAPEQLPSNAIITPNQREFEHLFQKNRPQELETATQLLQQLAQQYQLTITSKGNPTVVANSDQTFQITGGNAGMTKGGHGDCLAGLTAALVCTNPTILAAASADFIVKATADRLFETQGPFYSADDIAEHIPSVLYDVLQS